MPYKCPLCETGVHRAPAHGIRWGWNSARTRWYPFKGKTPASAAILFARGQVAVACIGYIATCLCSQKKYHGRGSPCVLGRMNTAPCPPPFFHVIPARLSSPGECVDWVIVVRLCYQHLPPVPPSRGLGEGKAVSVVKFCGAPSVLAENRPARVGESLFF